MSLRYALLGLLAHRSASGYDLMGTFRSSFAHVRPATQSQDYGELTLLTNAGLLTVAAEIAAVAAEAERGAGTPSLRGRTRVIHGCARGSMLSIFLRMLRGWRAL